jgi:hypothetical protein
MKSQTSQNKFKPPALLRRGSRYITTKGNYKGYKYVFKCFCGNEFETLKQNVNDGSKTSCGCLRHNKCYTKEYNSWVAMIQRCNNPRNHKYKIYGERGITVCKKWVTSFKAFYDDMGPKPSLAYSLDRIDTNKGYFKENCRWATPKEQARNTRANHLITYKNQTKCIAEWALILNFKYRTLGRRFERGWSIEKAFTTPVGKNATK